MKSFLQQVFLDNAVQDYLWTIGIILSVLLLKKIISRYLAGLICRLFRRQWKNLDVATFISLVIYPLSVFLVVTVCIVSLYRLHFPAGLNVVIYRYPLQRIFHTIGILIQIISFIWLLLRIIDFIATILEQRASLTPDQSDNQLVIFFKDFVKVIFGLVGILMVLKLAFNYNIGSLLTGLSIVGAAVALALRESLENLIASFIIFFDKPFTTGDLVKVQNITGNVERIGLRSTRIRTADKSYVTVPNKQMVDSILDNVSLRSQMRGELILSINVQTPPQKIEELIRETKSYLSGVEEVNTFTVLFNDIKLQAFIVTVEFFTMPMEWSRFTGIKQELNLFVLQTMERSEIRLAAEGRDIAILP